MREHSLCHPGWRYFVSCYFLLITSTAFFIRVWTEYLKIPWSGVAYGLRSSPLLTTQCQKVRIHLFTFNFSGSGMTKTEATLQVRQSMLPYALGAWLLVELIASLGPLVLPNTWYLQAYLSDTAIEKTNEFLNNASALVPSNTRGWENRPGFERGEWVIDEFGGRHHRKFTLDKPANTVRTLFLGSSLINGSNAVDNHGTISALFENQYQMLHSSRKNQLHLEAMNFATMMYTLDQIRIQIPDLLYLGPDQLIIGLHEDPSAGLKSVYIPFRLPSEENMPFVKPFFSYGNDQLQQHSAPLWSLASLDQQALNEFKAHDDYYYEFSRFSHFSFMPITDYMSRTVIRGANMLDYFNESPSDFMLIRALMADIQAIADQQNIEVSYLYLPTQRSLVRPHVWKVIPDYYQNRLKWLQAEWSPEEITKIKQPPLTQQPHVIDVRRSFRESGLPASKLYIGDGLHFTRQGNSLIAEAILKALYTDSLR